MRRLTVLVLASAAFGQDMLAEGQRLMEAEDYKGAAEAFGKAIEGAPGDARGYAGRARAFQEMGRHASALKDLSKAIEIAAEPDALLHANRAFSRWRLGDHDGAIVDCGTAIALARAGRRFVVEAFAHRVRGDAFHGKHEDAAALVDYDKALELEPDDATTLHRRGEAKQALRDFKGAIADFARLSAVAPDSPVPLALRGRARLLVGDYAGAVEDLDAAVANGGAEFDPTLHASCARARWALGQKDAADACAAKAAEAAAPDALAEAGRYFFDTGRAKEAAAALQRAVDADPEGQDYARLYLFLARARLGERALAAGQLKAYLDGSDRDDWYARVARFLYGHVKEEELLAAAGSSNPQLALEQECEAAWYAGAVRLLGRDNAGALLLFERCHATDVRTFIEWESARMALAAMNR